MQVFGERIHIIRKKHKQTQGEMADLLGVNIRTIANWESGVRTPTIETMSEIARLYSVSTDYLLGKDEDDLHANIKLAVFGDPDVTDEQFEEIKKIARSILERDKK